MKPIPSLLALVLCVAAVGPAVAATQTTADARLSGQVVDDDGKPVANAKVLVEAENESTLAEQTRRHDVTDSLRKLAAAPPEGVWVAETDGDGRYSLSVPAGQYRVVAVAGERVSHRHEVAIDDDASRNLTVARNHVLSLEGSGATARPNETASVTLAVPNVDDEPVRNLTIDLAVRDVLEVVTVDAPGATVANGTVRFETLAAGENATVTVTVRPVADAGRTTADVDATAWSDDHFVDATTGATVAVRPEDSTPTPTALPAGDGAGETTTERSTPVGTGTDGDAREPPSPTPTGGIGPGFSSPLALAALVGIGLLARRR